MKAIWQWIGSPAYWRLAAIFTGIYLTIAALGQKGDWFFAASIGLGFWLCWTYSAYAHSITQPSASPNPPRSD
jgi:hypothetical protein